MTILFKRRSRWPGQNNIISGRINFGAETLISWTRECEIRGIVLSRLKLQLEQFIRSRFGLFLFVSGVFGVSGQLMRILFKNRVHPDGQRTGKGEEEGGEGVTPTKRFQLRRFPQTHPPPDDNKVATE